MNTVYFSICLCHRTLLKHPLLMGEVAPHYPLIFPMEEVTSLGTHLSEVMLPSASMMQVN